MNNFNIIIVEKAAINPIGPRWPENISQLNVDVEWCSQ
jgi:hypothetical protein